MRGEGGREGELVWRSGGTGHGDAGRVAIWRAVRSGHGGMMRAGRVCEWASSRRAGVAQVLQWAVGGVLCTSWGQAVAMQGAMGWRVCSLPSHWRGWLPGKPTCLHAAASNRRRRFSAPQASSCRASDLPTHCVYTCLRLKYTHPIEVHNDSTHAPTRHTPHPVPHSTHCRASAWCLMYSSAHPHQ